MKIRTVAALALLLPLCGCITPGTGSVVGGECKVFERPQYAVRGVRPYDQDWIDSTVEGGVGACHWARPAARPAELDASPLVVKAPVAAPLKKHMPKWLSMIRAWPKRAMKPVAAVPAAPTPIEAVPVAEAAPALPPVARTAIDDLLDPK